MSVFILKSDVQNTIRKEKTDRHIQLHFKSPQSQSPQFNHNKMKHTPWFFSNIYCLCTAHFDCINVYLCFVLVYNVKLSKILKNEHPKKSTLSSSQTFVCALYSRIPNKATGSC